MITVPFATRLPSGHIAPIHGLGHTWHWLGKWRDGLPAQLYLPQHAAKVVLTDLSLDFEGDNGAHDIILRRNTDRRMAFLDTFLAWKDADAEYHTDLPNLTFDAPFELQIVPYLRCDFHLTAYVPRLP